MDWCEKAVDYWGRNPRESPLWQLLDNHFDEFEYRYGDLLSMGEKSKREKATVSPNG
jgi:arginine/ornithine N-succinyltransferase beta subunit